MQKQGRRGFWTEEHVRDTLNQIDGDQRQGGDEQNAPQVQEAGQDQAVAEAVQEELEMPQIEDILHQLYGTLHGFWQEHKPGFVQMWSAISKEDRKNMILSVCPHMPSSNKDLSCACERRCLENMRTSSMISPELNLADLIGDGKTRNSIDLVQLYDMRTKNELEMNMADVGPIRHAYRFPLPDPSLHIVVDNLGKIAGKRGTGLRMNTSSPQADQQELRAKVCSAPQGVFVTEDEWKILLERQRTLSLVLCSLADEYLSEWAGLKKVKAVSGPLVFPGRWREGMSDRELYILERGHFAQSTALGDQGREHARKEMILALTRADIGIADAVNVDVALDLKNRGNNAFSSGQISEAKRLYTRANDVLKRIQHERDPWLCLEPQHYELWATCLCNRAECFLRLGDPESAEEDTVEILEWMPRGPIPEKIIDKAIDRLQRAKQAIEARAKQQGRPKSKRNKAWQSKAQHLQRVQQRPTDPGAAGQEQHANGEAGDEKESGQTAAQFLQSGNDVNDSHAFNKDECYVCMVDWAQVTTKVLVPLCRHAVCERCCEALRRIERKDRKAAGAELSAADKIQCGICREFTLVDAGGK